MLSGIIGARREAAHARPRRRRDRHQADVRVNPHLYWSGSQLNKDGRTSPAALSANPLKVKPIAAVTEPKCHF